MTGAGELVQMLRQRGCSEIPAQAEGARSPAGEEWEQGTLWTAIMIMKGLKGTRVTF